MELSDIKGIGRKKMELLRTLGINELQDMLSYDPVSYEDRSTIVPIGEMTPGRSCCVRGAVSRITKGYMRGRGGSVVRVDVGDASGSMEVVFFNARYMASNFTCGEQYYFYGRPFLNGKKLQMAHPSFSSEADGAVGRILPVYRTVKGLSQKEMRRIAGIALDECDISERLPSWMIEKRRLMGLKDSLANIHFPADRKRYAAARYRMIYEEMVYFRLAMSMIKGHDAGRMRGISFPSDDSIAEFCEGLDFELTGAQKRVLEEISHDMESDLQMQRLLQGDVGSGKTVIAAAVLYKAAVSGCQGALMAPTELLASQHYAELAELFGKYGIKTGFLTSSIDKKTRAELLKGIENGDIGIVIGTHALIQEDVRFANLGLVVTDEQHRFGVRQRIALTSKGTHPDDLVMTATPIPRSLAAVLYNGMDVSFIDELPAGRRPVITKVFGTDDRKAVYEKVGRLLDEGQQAYVVAPLISASESIDCISAEEVYGQLKKLYKGHRAGLVHGAMSNAVKEQVMNDFAEGNIRVLAATVVIEVGINVPSATVMVIENAERFGMAQLHQLRGRVGRSDTQSYCFLIADPQSELGYERAKILEKENDGLRIAEQDLKMRGPGDILGTRQHGVPQWFISDMIGHEKIFNAAEEDVNILLTDDPELRQPEHAALKEAAEAGYELFEDAGL